MERVYICRSRGLQAEGGLGTESAAGHLGQPSHTAALWRGHLGGTNRSLVLFLTNAILCVEHKIVDLWVYNVNSINIL